jgi:hypothetical protein
MPASVAGIRTPSMACNRAVAKARRDAISEARTQTQSCGPRRASSAAHCAMEEGATIVASCTAVIDSIQRAGPAAKPTRHPVMA